MNDGLNDDEIETSDRSMMLMNHSIVFHTYLRDHKVIHQGLFPFRTRHLSCHCDDIFHHHNATPYEEGKIPLVMDWFKKFPPKGDPKPPLVV